MKNVFIYGGCVSRDAVEHYPDYGLEFHSYIARQSLISAYHPANPAHWDFGTVKSSFQQRTFGGDVRSTLPGHIQANADDIDLIVWDHMIERVGIRSVTTGGYVTNSPKTRQNVEDPDLLGEQIKLGADHHLELWSDALDQLVETLKRAGLMGKVIVNGTPWALKDKHDKRTYYPKTGMKPEFFNETIQQYWGLIEDHGIPVARVDQDRAIADPDHKWGPAYFHYVPDTYKAQLDAITSII